MVFLHAIFIFTITLVILVAATFLNLILKTFAGKSIRSRSYPPVIGTVFGQLVHFNSLYDYLTEAAKRHRTFRMVVPDKSEIYTTDMNNIEHVLRTNFDKYSIGQYNRDILEDFFGQGIFAVDGEKWRRQRKVASFEFSTRVLKEFSCKVFRKNAAKLTKTIVEFSNTKSVLNAHDLLMRYSMNSIFRAGFGMDLNSLEGSSGEEETEFIKAFDDSNQITFWRFVDPFWKLKRWLNVGSEASLKRNIKIIHGFADRVIRIKKEQLELQHESDEKEDILSRFLVESKKDPEKMNEAYLRDVILNFIIAGKDTTANTLSWFLYMICKNPVTQERIAQEIRDVTFAHGNQTEDTDCFIENITDEVLVEMHYLHAALTETLRLYPAVAVDGKCSETDDVLPDGYRVKKGDGVYYISYAMGRMTDLWGDDAEQFKPERWLQDGRFRPESPFKFIAFHAGPRMCLGKEFAYRQMKIVSIALLRFLRFRLADERKTVTYRTMFTLHINGGLHLFAVPRTFI